MRKVVYKKCIVYIMSLRIPVVNVKHILTTIWKVFFFPVTLTIVYEVGLKIVIAICNPRRNRQRKVSTETANHSNMSKCIKAM